MWTYSFESGNRLFATEQSSGVWIYIELSWAMDWLWLYWAFLVDWARDWRHFRLLEMSVFTDAGCLYRVCETSEVCGDLWCIMRGGYYRRRAWKMMMWVIFNRWYCGGGYRLASDYTSVGNYTHNSVGGNQIFVFCGCHIYGSWFWLSSTVRFGAASGKRWGWIFWSWFDVFWTCLNAIIGCSVNALVRRLRFSTTCSTWLSWVQVPCRCYWSYGFFLLFLLLLLLTRLHIFWQYCSYSYLVAPIAVTQTFLLPYFPITLHIFFLEDPLRLHFFIFNYPYFDIPSSPIPW